MYFVGKYGLMIGGEYKAPGAELPTEFVDQWPNKRDMLMNGHITCDYKNGEKKPHELSFVGKSTIIDDKTIFMRLVELGIPVPDDAPQKLVHLVYNAVFCKQDIDLVASQLRIKPILPSWVPDHIREQVQPSRNYGDELHEHHIRIASAHDLLKLKPVDVPEPNANPEGQLRKVVDESEREAGKGEHDFQPRGPEQMDRNVVNHQMKDDAVQRQKEAEELKKLREQVKTQPTMQPKPKQNEQRK